MDKITGGKSKRNWFILLVTATVGLVVFLYASGSLEGIISSPDTKKGPETYEQIGNLYRNKEYNFRIKFPEGWEQETGDGPHIVRKATQGNRVIVIGVNELPKFLSGVEGNITDLFTLEEFKQDVASKIAEGFKGNLIDAGITQIDNRNAYWASFETSYSALDITAEGIMVMYQMFHNGNLYTISTGSSKDEFVEVEGILKLSVSTFVFEDY